MRVVSEEIFGPVVCAMPWDDVDDLVRKANDTIYGLAAGIWTSDLKKAHLIADGLRAGTVWINCYNFLDPASPFGGYKQSGWGRERGRYGVEQYTELKSVWVNLGFSHFAFALFRKSSIVAVGLLTFGSVRISMSAGPFALASSAKTVSNSSLLAATADGIP